MSGRRSEAVSAGRLCLLGEHCDWAGGASLVVPIRLPLRGRFEPAPSGSSLQVRSKLRGVSLASNYSLPIAEARLRDDTDPLRYVAAVAAELEARGLGRGAGVVGIASQLPSGRGFSSSAALCVATADVLSSASGHDLSPDELADVAYAAERERVGVLCGRLDPIACAHGRPLAIDWQAPPAVREVTPGAALQLVVGAFEEPRDTVGILAALNRHVDGDGEPADCRAARETISGWGRAAVSGAAALRAGHLERLGDLMNRAQEAYERLARRLPSLAAPRLKAVCDALRRVGALGAKFSGAGGDGSVIALATNDGAAASLTNVLRDAGLRHWRV